MTVDDTSVVSDDESAMRDRELQRPAPQGSPATSLSVPSSSQTASSWHGAAMRERGRAIRRLTQRSSL